LYDNKSSFKKRFFIVCGNLIAGTTFFKVALNITDEKQEKYSRRELTMINFATIYLFNSYL